MGNEAQQAELTKSCRSQRNWELDKFSKSFTLDSSQSKEYHCQSEILSPKICVAKPIDNSTAPI